MLGIAALTPADLPSACECSSISILLPKVSLWHSLLSVIIAVQAILCLKFLFWIWRMLLNQRWKEWEYTTPFRTCWCTFVIRGTDWKCKPSLLLAAFSGGVLARVVQRVWRTMNLQHADVSAAISNIQ